MKVMTTSLTFYDAAYPPASPPDTDGVCIYLSGGNEVHAWSMADVQAQRARYRLPIFVRSNPANANPSTDVIAAVTALHELGAPSGILVAWDVETSDDPGYILAVYRQLKAAGYELIVYGSQSTVFGNENPDGLYWGAQWTGTPHIAVGNAMTQYISFPQYDESVALPSLPFWDTHTPQAPAPAPSPVPAPVPAPSWEDKLVKSLPTIISGDVGFSVKTVQGLCCARGHATVIDGNCGPRTITAIRAVQADFHLTVDGIVGPKTWVALIAGSM